MQSPDVNLQYLCCVTLRVHACKSEVINEQYCSYIHAYTNETHSIANLQDLIPTCDQIHLIQQSLFYMFCSCSIQCQKFTVQILWLVSVAYNYCCQNRD